MDGKLTVRDRTRSGHAHGIWLFVLLVLFAFRVAGQLVQVVAPTDVLPALELWQGSTTPYGWLLFVQAMVMGGVAWAAVRIGTDAWAPNRRIGRGLLALGAVYFSVMLGRIVLGSTLLEGHWWFDRPIPAFFHLVLAAIVLTIGHYHWTRLQ